MPNNIAVSVTADVADLPGKRAIMSAELKAVLSPMGLAIAAVVGVTVAATVATIQYEAEQRKLAASVIGVGVASGLSVTQLEAAGQAAAKWSGQSVSASTEAATAFAA